MVPAAEVILPVTAPCSAAPARPCKRHPEQSTATPTTTRIANMRCTCMTDDKQLLGNGDILPELGKWREHKKPNGSRTKNECEMTASSSVPRSASLPARARMSLGRSTDQGVMR